MSFFRKSSITLASISLFMGISLNVWALQMREIIQTKSGRQDARTIKIEESLKSPIIGETLTYKISWLGLSAGQITARVHEEELLKNKPVYKVTLEVKTTGFVNLIYKVNDLYTSIIDKKSLGSLEHHVNRSEGNYRKNSLTIFDASNRMAYFENFLDKSKKEFPTPALPLDGLSAAYYFRTLSITEDQTITLDIINDEKDYHLEGEIDRIGYVNMGRRLGIFPACRIKPLGYVNGELIKKGKVEVYFSTGKKRIPLYVRIRGPLFTEVIAKLIKMSY